MTEKKILKKFGKVRLEDKYTLVAHADTLNSQQVREIFEQFGEIKAILVKDGIAVVKFKSSRAAERALSAFNKNKRVQFKPEDSSEDDSTPPPPPDDDLFTPPPPPDDDDLPSPPPEDEDLPSPPEDDKLPPPPPEDEDITPSPPVNKTKEMKKEEKGITPSPFYYPCADQVILSERMEQFDFWFYLYSEIASKSSDDWAEYYQARLQDNQNELKKHGLIHSISLMRGGIGRAILNTICDLKNAFQKIPTGKKQDDLKNLDEKCLEALIAERQDEYNFLEHFWREIIRSDDGTYDSTIEQNEDFQLGIIQRILSQTQSLLKSYQKERDRKKYANALSNQIYQLRTLFKDIGREACENIVKSNKREISPPLFDKDDEIIPSQDYNIYF